MDWAYRSIRSGVYQCPNGNVAGGNVAGGTFHRDANFLSPRDVLHTPSRVDTKTPRHDGLGAMNQFLAAMTQPMKGLFVVSITVGRAVLVL